MSVDLNKAGILLHIVSKAKDWSNLKGLHDIAMDELEGMAKQAAEDLAEKRADAKAKADEEAAKLAEAQAKEASDAEEAQASRQSKLPLGGMETTSSDAVRRV